MQLVCPAGNLPSLKAAVDNGADAVYIETMEAQTSLAPGEPIRVHVHNHGANSWRFVHLRRTR